MSCHPGAVTRLLMDEETIARITSHQGAENHVLCWGCAEFGQHGQSKKENVPAYNSWLKTFSSSLEKRAKYFSCGSSHAVLVTQNNNIYSWGNGLCGQVGCGDQDSHDEPICIKLYANQQRPPEIKGIACGWRHTFILLENGNMFSYGNNQYAQLGYDPRIKEFRENQARPHLLRTFTHLVVEQVACGEKHTLFLIQDGTVGAVGNNSYGQLGCGDCGEATTMQKVDNLTGVKAIACGANHSLAVDNNGGLYCWGFGKACGLKDDNYIYPERKYVGSCRFTAVSGGSFHSMALSVTRNVFSWGSNSDGQLGQGERVRFMSSPSKVHDERLAGKAAFIACGDLYTSVITADGSLFMWGKSSYVIDEGRQPAENIWQPMAVDVGGYPIKRIACGGWHVVALTGKPDLKDVTATNGTSDANGIYVEGDSSSDEDGSDSDSDSESLPLRLGDRQPTIGDFYAPTPEPNRNGFIQTPRKKYDGTYDSRQISNVSSQYPTARSDSTEPDFRPIAVYINEIHENGAETATTDNNWTLDKLNSNHTASYQNNRFSANESNREKREVRLSNGEIMPELGSRLEKTNTNKLLTDNSLPGRQVPKSSPYGLYRSKTTLNPVLTKKSLDRSIIDNFHLEREPTTIRNKNIGFITPEDLRPVPKYSHYNDLWQPLDDSGNHMQYKMIPNRVRKTKTTAEKKAEIISRKVFEGDMSTSTSASASSTLESLQTKPVTDTQAGRYNSLQKPQFPPSTVFTHVRSKTFVGGEKPPLVPPAHALKMFPRQHTSMVDLRLCAERMNIANNHTFPLKPIVKDSRKLHPPSTSPSRLMTKRNKTILVMEYNRRKEKSQGLPKPKVRQSPVLSAPTSRSRKNRP